MGLNTVANMAKNTSMMTMSAADFNNAKAMYANIANMNKANMGATQALGNTSIDSMQSALSEEIKQLTSSNLSVSDQLSQSASASNLSGSTDYIQGVIESMSSSASKGSSSSGSKGVLDGATESYKAYLKAFFPNMSDEQIANSCKSMTSQYGDLAKLMDMSSIATSIEAMASAANSITSGSAVDGAANVYKAYLKAFFPNMSDEQISASCKSMISQYGNLAKLMDMSSITASIEAMASAANSSTGSTGSTGSASSVGNNGNYGANKGVSGLLSDAGAMVGMTESRNAAQINKITKKSGINCQTTPWCAAWAMNMLKDHGVLNTSSCSNVNYCPTIVNWAKKENIWAGRGSYTPQAGDAILFDWQGDGTSDHIGIVEKVANGKVYTIEGNSSNSVARRSYSLNSKSVMGYINCAAQKK